MKKHLRLLFFIVLLGMSGPTNRSYSLDAGVVSVPLATKVVGIVIEITTPAASGVSGATVGAVAAPIVLAGAGLFLFAKYKSRFLTTPHQGIIHFIEQNDTSLIILDTFKQNNIFYDWPTFLVGRQLDFISPSVVQDYATEYISKNPDTTNMKILRIAAVLQDSEIDNLLNTMELQSFDKELEERKYRYLLLSQLDKKYKNKLANFIDKREFLIELRDLYYNFGASEDMASFVTYNHPPGQEGYLLDEPEVDRMIKYFHDFLQKERVYLQKR